MHLKETIGTIGHLCYCSNIHPGESWQDVRANLTRYIPEIRQALHPDGDFGLGLRLSAAAVNDLASPEVLAEFKAFLAESNSYVFTINGFPYGPFHGTRVKEDVYLPDWKDTERLRYSNQLADVFSEFLPDGQVGSISTVPGAFKTSVEKTDDVTIMAKYFVQHVAHLVRLERKTGKSIILAIEPEPCCFLETVDESIDFFHNHLYSQAAVKQLGNELSTSATDAEQLLHKHLTLCLDLCHAAVEFEDCNTCIDALDKAEIEIGKLQISAGLLLPEVNKDSARVLEPYIDKVYLHQVIEKKDGVINRYKDLPDALETLEEDGASREWRVHFHVPIFHKDLGNFSSTQFFISEALARHKVKPISEHLEVETYTWNVLPPELRNISVEEAITRELEWVVHELS